MKEALRDAGVPTAQSTSTADLDEARAFAAHVGFPLIVKPRSSAGTAGTAQMDSPAELERALAAAGVGRGASVAREEFIEGHEGFWDTLTANGEVVHEFISHYYPGVLDAMRHRWISPYVITTNRIDAPAYSEVKAMGRQVLRALGIGTSATHMEWFFGPRGLKFSEIGCRPLGVSVWDLYSAANDLDLYREWAATIVHGRPLARPSRRYAAGMIALRPDRDGRIAGYKEVKKIQSAFGRWILDAHLPSPGTPTQPIEAGYMANAWLRVRHPDYDELRRMLDAIGQTVKVRAG